MGEQTTKPRPFWLHPFIVFPLLALALLAAIPVIGTLSIMAHWAAKEQSPAEDITQWLQRSFDLDLPTGSTVVASHRVPAGMDSAGAYELSIPPAAVAGFVEQIRDAATAKGYQVRNNASDPFTYAPSTPPAWWTPAAAGITTWLELTRPGSQAYTIGFSPVTGRCFIHWMTF